MFKDILSQQLASAVAIEDGGHLEKRERERRCVYPKP